MSFTREDYLLWKEHPVTKAMFEEVRETAEEIASEVLNRVEANHDRDQWIKGFLKGVATVRAYEPEYSDA